MRKITHALLGLSLLTISCSKDSSSYFSSSESVGQGGSMARFTIVDQYLYSVDEQELKVFDLSIPDAPVLKSTQHIGFEIETIFPFKDKLFIGSATQVHIFSLDDPARPKKLSVAISPEVLRRCDPVVAKDSVAYATLRTNGPCGGSQSILAVYDIRKIEAPVQVASYHVGEPYGLGYSNDVLYVCDRERGLLLFDISDGFHPQLLDVSLRDGSYIDVIPYGNTLICWVTNGMILYDITNNRQPKRITEIL